MKGLQRVLFFVILIFGCIFWICLSLSVFVFFPFLPFHSQKELTHIGDSRYQFQEFNFRTNKTTNALVTLNTKLLEDEFLSHRNERTGSLSIISNSASSMSSQFECTGSCSCSSTKRRYPAVVLTRSLFLLVSALSTSLALKIASEAFHDTCASQFASSSSCEEDDDSISSEVTSCLEKYSEGENKDYTMFADFSCSGHCLPRKFPKNWKFVSLEERFLEKTGGCEELKLSRVVGVKRVVVDGVFWYKTAEGENIVWGEQSDEKYRYLLKTAKKKFRTDLHAFCKANSQRGHIRKRAFPKLKKLKEEEDIDVIDASDLSGASIKHFCVGSGHSRSGNEKDAAALSGPNAWPNLDCVPLSVNKLEEIWGLKDENEKIYY